MSLCAPSQDHDQPPCYDGRMESGSAARLQRTIVNLPFDVHNLIIQQAGDISHPLSYSIDSAALSSLCLVSKLFNHIATPLLYSSITLRSPRVIENLFRTVEQHPAILVYTHSLRMRCNYHEDTLFSTIKAMESITSSAPALVRLFDDRDILYDVPPGLRELSMPSSTFVPSRLCRAFDFSGVERIATSTIFFSAKEDVDKLLELRSLTHLALANPCAARINRTLYDDGLSRYLNHSSALRRVIFGFPFRQDDFWVMLQAHITTRQDLRVVLLEYNEDETDREGHYWFGARVADGTLWDMEE